VVENTQNHFEHRVKALNRGKKAHHILFVGPWLYEKAEALPAS
jgi:hypothetical protein